MWQVNKGILRLTDLARPPSYASIAPLLRAGAVLAFRNVISFGRSRRGSPLSQPHPSPGPAPALRSSTPVG